MSRRRSPTRSLSHGDDQASSLCEAKSTYSGEQRLLYALCLVLYLLFQMSVQDLAAQPTHCRQLYIDPMRCIMPSHQQESSPSCHMGPIHALFFCIIRIISLLYPAWTGRSLVHRLHRRGLGTQVIRRHRHTSRGLRAGGDVVWQRCCGDIAMIKVSSGPARPGSARPGPASPPRRR